MIAFCSTYLFYTEKFIIQLKTTEKMIGHHTRLRVNGDLPLWRGPAVNKKLPFFNAHVHDIMRSRDAQCNTGEWP